MVKFTILLSNTVNVVQFGYTALSHSSCIGHTDVAALLLETKEDANIRDNVRTLSDERMPINYYQLSLVLLLHDSDWVHRTIHRTQFGDGAVAIG